MEEKIIGSFHLINMQNIFKKRKHFSKKKGVVINSNNPYQFLYSKNKIVKREGFGERAFATFSFTCLKAGSTSITFKLVKTRDTLNKEIITAKRNTSLKSK